MHRRQALKLFAGLALCPLCGPQGFAADDQPHWSYEGAEGPAKWGDLNAASRVCSVGSQQSPIDVGATVKAQLGPLNITWAKNADTIVNNGHTIQVNMGDSSVLAVGDGGNYRLVQFHFHRPSEHLIGGKSFPMEVHFVHANAGGRARRGRSADGDRPRQPGFQQDRLNHARGGRSRGQGRSGDQSE
jgi:carbonic anhydrase